MRGEPVLDRVPDLQSNIMSVAEKLSSIKPRTVLYLFSGGKDSSLALLLTRDCVKRLCEEIKCRVYMLYVYITGNTHPLNAYASYTVMLWHRKNYGFEVVVKARDRLFQEYMAKYGLQTGPGRWCYSEFKKRLIVEVERTLPQPLVEVDGMSPSDSKTREQKITAEFELVERSNGFKFYAWHPLYSLNLSSEEKLRILEQHEEFRPIVELYREFGDSLNCVVCPYKSIDKMMTHHGVEDLSAIYYFVKEALTSKKWHRKFSKLVNKTLIDNLESPLQPKASPFRAGRRSDRRP
jgi:3'-phosphoadenosine 5'-phosphosulfate sulfotransferase (PAPS reductase)/FAD synthetase